MRGEYKHIQKTKKKHPELPLRARRIPTTTRDSGKPTGTTSACAENTGGHTTGKIDYGNYLCVRGEYLTRGTASSPMLELPPRARRILTAHARRHGRGGTTSACAENTFGAGAYLFATRNYLRVRGEYQHAKDLGNDESELPPRARRIRCAVLHY